MRVTPSSTLISLPPALLRGFASRAHLVAAVAILLRSMPPGTMRRPRPRLHFAATHSSNFEHGHRNHAVITR
jgi:hypothetical protein